MPPRWKKKSSKKFLKTINKPPLSWLLGTKTWLVISGKTELQKNPKSWRKQLKEMYRALKTSQNCKRVDKKCINFYKSRIQIKKFLTFWVKNSIKKARWRKCSKTRIKGGTTKSLRKSEKTKRYPNKKEANIIAIFSTKPLFRAISYCYIDLVYKLRLLCIYDRIQGIFIEGYAIFRKADSLYSAVDLAIFRFGRRR